MTSSPRLQVNERPCLPVLRQPYARNARLANTRNGYQLFHSSDVCVCSKPLQHAAKNWAADILIRYFRIFLPFYGEWSHLEAAAILQHIPPGGTVVDVGTHIGTLTIPFAHRVRFSQHAPSPARSQWQPSSSPIAAIR